MKEFNLNKYLKDLSQKVVTKDGRKVRIICTNAKNEFPIIALITNDDKEVLMDYNNNGKVSPDEMTDLDLFFFFYIFIFWIMCAFFGGFVWLRKRVGDVKRV